MPEHWKTYKVADIAERVGIGPFGSSIKVETFVHDGVPVISGAHLGGVRLQDSKFNFITDEHAKRLSNANVYRGDIVFTHAGNIGQVAFIPENSQYDRYILSQRQFYLRCNRALALPEFVAYYFTSPEGQHKLLSNASSSGVPSIAQPVTHLRNIEIPIPTLREQQRIVSILGALDDKIELNRQLNETLEAIAQALFKRWFIDFQFPGFDGEFVDDVPKGWSRAKLGDIVEIKHGFPFRGEFFSEIETNDVLLTPGNFKVGGGFNNSKFKYYLGDVPPDYVLSKNDLVVTMTDLSKGGDTLGYSALVPSIPGKRLLHNQRLGKIIIKTSLPVKSFLYWTMRQPTYRHFVLGSATGSTVKHTSPSRICDYGITLPSTYILQTFEETTWALISKEQENLKENEILRELRDKLLPKLTSGEIPILE